MVSKKRSSFDFRSTDGEDTSLLVPVQPLLSPKINLNNYSSIILVQAITDDRHLFPFLSHSLHQSLTTDQKF